ncbi:MAG: transglutaminase family protein [Oscillospiraceae bacterium]|nr:transglutaminase family protein [Oscillospiraceae bacterium]
MKTISFAYSTRLTFDDNVINHSFALRCIPIESPPQRIVSYNLTVTPYTNLNYSTDTFGNNVASGYIARLHRYLDFDLHGVAVMDSTVPKTDLRPFYRFPSLMTKPNEKAEELFSAVRDKLAFMNPREKTVYLAEYIHSFLRYDKSLTGITTTAAEAIGLGGGVCQDFSHVLLMLLRMSGVHCRYIAGLSFCDGETHSWIEFWDGEQFVGYDPTNLCYATDEYIVLSQGRDYVDCAVDRGRMFGAYTRQVQLVKSKLEILSYE